MSMGGHQSAAMLKDEWLTPPAIIQALGEFDLDPCAPSDARRPWDTAQRHFCVEQNGLAQEWNGRVWLNPPYGLEAARWLERAFHQPAIRTVPIGVGATEEFIR